MKILIIGLRKAQVEKLKQSCKADIRSLDDGQEHKKAVSNAGDFDLIISVTKFTNHCTERCYSKYASFVRVSGAYSSVVQLLNQKGLCYA